MRRQTDAIALRETWAVVGRRLNGLGSTSIVWLEKLASALYRDVLLNGLKRCPLGTAFVRTACSECLAHHVACALPPRLRASLAPSRATAFTVIQRLAVLLLAFALSSAHVPAPSTP